MTLQLAARLLGMIPLPWLEIVLSHKLTTLMVEVTLVYGHLE